MPSELFQEKDIRIESEYPVHAKQVWNEQLIDKPIENIQESDYYTDFQPTRLQFEVTSSTPGQNIKVVIPYANRLTRTDAKYSVICLWNSAQNSWTPLKTNINQEKSELYANSNRVGIFCVFTNLFWYSKFTQRMADEYPIWTRIRNEKESVGQQFLNYFGIEFEMVEDYLNWISEQKYIQTADLQTYDWIKMYNLPDIKMTDDIKVFKDNQEIFVLETLQEFFYNDRNEGGILDYEDNRFYTAYDYGTLDFHVTRNNEMHIFTIEPMNYHLWNAFDEFGLLLGVERLYLEKNKDYKERILDVFRYPSGTHDIGLTNGIARDLNLIKRFIWKDDRKDCYLKNKYGKNIDIRTLRVDNQPLTEDEYMIDEAGNILIFKRNTGSSHEVSYIEGIYKHQVYDKSDLDLYKIMYQEDGQATSKLRKWVEYINTFAPVMWGHFNWDEGFWDTIDKKLTGLGYIPNIWDSSIECWK